MPALPGIGKDSVEDSQKKVADAVTTISIWLAKVRFKALDECQVNDRDFLLLEAVAGLGKMPSIKDLEEVLDRHISNCGRHAKQLVNDRLLAERREKKDGHSWRRVYLTPSGSNLVEKVQTALASQIKQMLRNGDDSTRRQLHNAFTSLNEATASTPSGRKAKDAKPQRSAWIDNPNAPF